MLKTLKDVEKKQSIVQLPTPGSTDSIQILITLQTAALDRFARAHRLLATASSHGVWEVSTTGSAARSGRISGALAG